MKLYLCKAPTVMIVEMHPGQGFATWKSDRDIAFEEHEFVDMRGPSGDTAYLFKRNGVCFLIDREHIKVLYDYMSIPSIAHR